MTAQKYMHIDVTDAKKNRKCKKRQNQYNPIRWGNNNEMQKE